MSFPLRAKVPCLNSPMKLSTNQIPAKLQSSSMTIPTCCRPRLTFGGSRSLRPATKNTLSRCFHRRSSMTTKAVSRQSSPTPLAGHLKQIVDNTQKFLNLRSRQQKMTNGRIRTNSSLNASIKKSTQFPSTIRISTGMVTCPSTSFARR